MKKYVIGENPRWEICRAVRQAAATSNAALAQVGAARSRVESYVAENKTFAFTSEK